MLPTAQLGDALPLVWGELSPNVENPVVIPSTDGKEYIMVFDALSMNATCRDEAGCGWVGGQCWSNTACNAIGVGWSRDGSVWEEAEHVVVQLDPASQCGAWVRRLLREAGGALAITMNSLARLLIVAFMRANDERRNYDGIVIEF